jgi:hypothetical protein
MDNIVGGPSIVFHRYHEAGVTKIKRAVYERDGILQKWNIGQEGNLVQQIIGYDANALYLWCMSQEMPCGQLNSYDIPEGMDNYVYMIRGIQSGALFGFAEVDIYVPENLWNHFIEMTPLFKNTVIGPEQLTPLMRDEWKRLNKINVPVVRKSGGKEQVEQHEFTRAHVPQKKLIGSYFAQKMLIYTPLLQWYLNHGLIVSRVHQFIEATRGRPFQQFAEDVSNARREGDSSKEKEILGDCMKQTGNDGFGRTVMNRMRHTHTIYTKDANLVLSKANDKLFNDCKEIMCDDGVYYELTTNKGSVKQNLPVQVGCAIFNLAKLRMLQFYYDCLDKYIDRSNFQLIQMDTDSCYMAVAGKSKQELAADFGVSEKDVTAEMRIKSLIRPELQDEFECEYEKWFPRKEHLAFDKRTPGLFKVEFVGDAMVALSPKSYFGLNQSKPDKSKLSAKGVQKKTDENRLLLTFEKYKAVLMNRKYEYATNIGFRVISNDMTTYQQVKIGLSPLYDKRAVMYDYVSTFPLNI